jgi:hypothetical protein
VSAINAGLREHILRLLKGSSKTRTPDLLITNKPPDQTTSTHPDVSLIKSGKKLTSVSRRLRRVMRHGSDEFATKLDRTSSSIQAPPGPIELSAEVSTNTRRYR